MDHCLTMSFLRYNNLFPCLYTFDVHDLLVSRCPLTIKVRRKFKISRYNLLLACASNFGFNGCSFGGLRKLCG